MPVPKKRLSHARQGRRRACWKATVPTLATCQNCGSKKLAHAVCGNCGYYKDRVVSTRWTVSAASDAE